MFTDMSLSRELLERFKASPESAGVNLEQVCEEVDHMGRLFTTLQSLGGVDFSVLVLATGSWPLQPPATNFSIPKELQACEQLFQKFYQAQHSGRKLNWLHQLSKGELKTRYYHIEHRSRMLLIYCVGILVLLNLAIHCRHPLIKWEFCYNLTRKMVCNGVVGTAFKFNTEMTTDELQIATQLTDSVLKTTLVSLVKTKVSII